MGEADAETPTQEAAAVEEVAPVAEEDKKDLYREIKKVPKPDEAEHKERLAAEAAKIGTKQERLETIRATLEARDSRDQGDSEMALAKRKYNEARLQSRRLHHEKRSIYDQIFDADKQKKQQEDLTKRLKAELQQLDVGQSRAADIAVEDIDRKIKALENHQQTSSLTVREEKKIMEDIKRLAAKKPVIKQYEDAQDALREVREHHNNLYTQVKAKMKQQEEMKKEEELCKDAVDEAKARDDAKRSDLPALFKERDQIRKDIAEIREEQSKIREEYNKQKRDFSNYLRAVKEQKQQIWLAQQAERKAHDDLLRKEREEEEAKRDPWEEEKAICEQLISYVEKLMPKSSETPSDKAALGAADVPANMTMRKRDDDDDYLAVMKKKGKKKGGGAAGGKKSQKISHSPDNFNVFNKLGFKAPTETSELPELRDKLLEKREWLKSAPPKKKAAPTPAQAPVEEAAAAGEAEEAEAEEASAPAEAPEFDLAAAKAAETAEREAKAAADAKKAAEKLKAEEANQERAEALEASGKKVAGGVHKFDASEVDVEGGSGTADDFLDAFGFGGDDEEAAAAGEAEEAEAEEASAPAEAPEFDLAAAKAAETAEREAKAAADAKKAAEKLKAEEANQERAEALEASGKKVAGGVHKFDASEVDVEGGSGTADDFLDAFGFGGDDEEAAAAGEAEEAEAEEASAPAEAPEFDLAAAKAAETAEREAKAAADAKKAAEKLKAEEANQERAEALEASGKKVAGGVHKFDASEVDVEGGSGTADDFLDAFGFGGDDEAAPANGEAAAEAAAEVQVEAAEGAAAEVQAAAQMPNGKAPDILRVQATTASTVVVSLDLSARK
eukprot:CAMPEP_0119403894 /NCGR_PEP_ID=MMETSP1334-20130426/143616_1 /TAXON_ID=127549 /ORGANISM="Calcidiscus leptoporus, Strain RCC1130" /LENGTH=844 /DNA_ID=CAMNT_0007427845 /DNA_START=23 /DNA_END=2557 /DNA_ORIENTATION=+